MTLLQRLFGKDARGPDVSGSRRDDHWTATHQHRKGGYYRLVIYGVLEADRSPVAIYDDADGNVWVRPVAEFEDGRFTVL